MNTIHRFAAVTLAAGALVVPVALSSSAAAAGPVITGGLVNVTIVDTLNDNDVLNDVTVTIPVSLGAALGIAANVCDTNVNILARQLRNGGATCTSDAGDQTVTISQITG
ncbi:MAG: hypothetical protein M3487_11430 [Actinomycetota bacterium]|nr:hypothetical protein [Actinomycetota bacterium]